MTEMLFLRSRRLPMTVAGIVLLHVVGFAVGGRQLSMRPDSETGSDIGVPWLIFMPVAYACLIGLSLRSPLHDLDLTAARRLAAWRVVQVVALAVAAAVSLAVLTRGLTGPTGTASALRNLAGFLGLALLGSRLISGWLVWLPPTAWAITAAMLGDPTNTGLPWDWPVRYDIDYGAFALATLLLIGGLVTARQGARTVRAEID